MFWAHAGVRLTVHCMQDTTEVVCDNKAQSIVPLKLLNVKGLYLTLCVYTVPGEPFYLQHITIPANL